MRKKAVLYPYCGEVLAAVRLFEELQEEYEISQLVAPSGFGCVGKDAGYANNHPKAGRMVLGEIPWEDEEWETLLLFEPVIQPGEYFLEDCLKEAVLQGKEVVFLCSCETDVPDGISEIIQSHPGQAAVRAYSVVPLENGDSDIHEPEIPVLLVGGLLKEADCFDVLLALTERFRRDGERIVVFSGHPTGSLFGFYSLEHIWKNREMSEDEKIRAVNHYINYIARRSSANVILLEAPDALMKYNEAAPNGFGIRSYMLCQAAAPDCLVGCIPFDLAQAELLTMLGEDFSCRLGCGLQAVHVSNLLLDTADTLRRQAVEAVHADLKFVRQQLEEQGGKSAIPMFDIISDGIDGMYERIRGND